MTLRGGSCVSARTGSRIAWLSAFLAVGAVGVIDAVAGESASVEVLQVRPDVYVLDVDGVNVTMQTGQDGTILVDSGPASGAAALLAAIQGISRQPIYYIVDTSADADLIGGTAQLAPAGQSLISLSQPHVATVVAREALVEKLLLQPAGHRDSMLPNETFTRPQYNFYLNGQGVAVMWQPAAHSDVDLAVRFWGSDVVAAGAIFDMTRFPVIDVDHGGSVQGEIDALNRLINTQVISPIPVVTDTGGTLVIPIRGPVSDQADLVTYRDMVADVRDRIAHLIAQHRTLAQIEASDPTQGYDARFGASTGSWTTTQFVEAVYHSLLLAKKTNQHIEAEGQ